MPSAVVIRFIDTVACPVTVPVVFEVNMMRALPVGVEVVTVWLVVVTGAGGGVRSRSPPRGVGQGDIDVAVGRGDEARTVAEVLLGVHDEGVRLADPVHVVGRDRDAAVDEALKASGLLPVPPVSTWMVVSPTSTSASACPVIIPATSELNVTSQLPPTVPGLAQVSVVGVIGLPAGVAVGQRDVDDRAVRRRSRLPPATVVLTSTVNVCESPTSLTSSGVDA